MRTALLLVLLCVPLELASQQVSLETGTLTLPPGFSHEAKRGTDSYPGIVRRSDSSMTIHYDIGAMAGIHVHPSRVREYLWMFEHEIGGHKAYSALFVRNGQRIVATSVVGSRVEPWSLPANFEAAVKNERDIAEFMVIVVSYRIARRVK